MKIPSVLCMGKASQDVFLRDEEFDPHCEGQVCWTNLPLGVKLDIDDMIFSTGGNATNVATTFARQGLHSHYLWALGHDPASEAVLEALDKEGVDTSRVVQKDNLASSYSTILIANSGERTIMNHHGSPPSLSEVKKLLETAPKTDWVYPSSLGSMDALKAVVDFAIKNGSKIMLNPASTELAHSEKLRALLSDIDILCLNKEEMQTIVEGETLEELTLHGLNYCSVVLVTDGPNGVVASDGKTLVKAGMYEDVPVIDRTGAGDAFASGFLSQWILGKSLRESIIFASANSTSVVGFVGAKEGILKRDTNLHDMEVQETVL